MTYYFFAAVGVALIVILAIGADALLRDVEPKLPKSSWEP